MIIHEVAHVIHNNMLYDYTSGNFEVDLSSEKSKYFSRFVTLALGTGVHPLGMPSGIGLKEIYEGGYLHKKVDLPSTLDSLIKPNSHGRSDMFELFALLIELYTNNLVDSDATAKDFKDDWGAMYELIGQQVFGGREFIDE